MALPLINENMLFDAVLKAIENTLKAEAINQVSLGGVGWNTVRERFDPWNVEVDGANPGVVNVAWSLSNFPEGEGSSFQQASLSTFDIDCYASQVALESAGVITPKDQRAADVLHALVTKVYYTIMSPIYYDLGLTPGTIVKPWIAGITKFQPVETNIPVAGVLAARMDCRIKFSEVPPQLEGVPLDVINVKADTEAGGLTDQTLDVT